MIRQNDADHNAQTNGHCKLEGADGEIFEILNLLPEGEKIIDAVLAGHSHKVVHEFYKGIPIIQSKVSAEYASALYFTFNKAADGWTLDASNTVIEGPIKITTEIPFHEVQLDVTEIEGIIAKALTNTFKETVGEITKDVVLSEKIDKLKKE